MSAPATQVRVVCPSWCVETQEDHLAELDVMEGYALHRSAEVAIAGTDLSVQVEGSTHASGSPDPLGRPAVLMVGQDEEFTTPERAEALARALLDAARMVRSIQA